MEIPERTSAPEGHVPAPPPTGLWSVEPPMESHLHLMQVLILLDSLGWHWRDRHDYFASGNLTIYYSAEQTRKRDFRGPDFFVVLDTHDRPRRSWTVWEEGGRTPDVIVEVLSASTASVDRGEKKRIYEQILRVTEYLMFDPLSGELEGYRLVGGSYERTAEDPDGRLPSTKLGLLFGVHEGRLRFFTTEGELVPSGIEAASEAEARVDRMEERAQRQAQRADEEAQRAEEEAQRADREAERADRLARLLREAGIDPDE